MVRVHVAHMNDTPLMAIYYFPWCLSRVSAKHEEGVGEALRGTRAAQHRGEREGVWRHRGRGTMGVRQGVRDERRMAASVAHAVTWRWKAEVLLLWGQTAAELSVLRS